MNYPNRVATNAWRRSTIINDVPEAKPTVKEDTGINGDIPPKVEVTKPKTDAEQIMELKDEVLGEPKPLVSETSSDLTNKDDSSPTEKKVRKGGKLTPDKPISPVFSQFLDKERRKRETQMPEEEIAQEDIEDFSDVTDLEDSYNESSPWPFFILLITGAFCISASLFYWALE